MKFGGVYAIYQGSLERFMYVGSSQNMRRRVNEHKRFLYRGEHINPHLQYAWNKYGVDDFFFVGVEKCQLSEVLEREQYWLDTLRPVCNIAKYADSPMRGRRLSKSTRERLSAIQKARTSSPEVRRQMSERAKGNGNARGVKHSDETRRKVSASLIGNSRNKGRKASPETRAKMSASKMGNKSALGSVASAELRAKRSARMIGNKLARKDKAVCVSE